MKLNFIKRIGLFSAGAMLLASCGGGGGGLTTELTITFETDGGTSIPAQKVKYGQKATRPSDPEKEGFTFDNWYADSYHKVLFDFDEAITADWTVYANYFSGGSSSSATGLSSDSGTESTATATDTDTSTPVGDVTYSITGLPDWITDDGCVIFGWVWGANEPGKWVACEYGDLVNDKPTKVSFTVSEEMQGCLLARCKGGTTQPDWQEKDHVPGRVYNQSADITFTSGTYSYPCGTWKDYNPK